MTPEKSLQVISDAIAKSRRDFERSAGRPMVLWGIIVFVFSFMVWGLCAYSGKPAWNFLWFGVPVVGWPLTLLLVKNEKKSRAKNFVITTMAQVWTIYGIFATVLALALGFAGAPEYIACVITVLIGFAAAVTGILAKNHWITAGGIISGIGCTVALVLFKTNDMNLLFTVIALLNLILPGIMMNRNK